MLSSAVAMQADDISEASDSSERKVDHMVVVVVVARPGRRAGCSRVADQCLANVDRDRRSATSDSGISFSSEPFVVVSRPRVLGICCTNGGRTG